jgi:hypothetical protein
MSLGGDFLRNTGFRRILGDMAGLQGVAPDEKKLNTGMKPESPESQFQT